MPEPSTAEPSSTTDQSAAAAALANIDPRAGVPKPDPVLIVEGLRRSFGGLAAVDIDHMEIQRSMITALIGPNGAGKTTLFNLLAGFDRPSAGSWQFDGRQLNGKRPYQVAQAGMVRTFQLTRALSKLTVRENLMLGAPGQRGERLYLAAFASRWREQEAAVGARADQMLRRFGLADMRDELGGTLSGGQRKLLEMARALMTEPKLVMLDEPMAGVNPVLRQSLLGHVADLRDRGMTVMFVEHDMDVVMDISDWVIVMVQGRVIAEGPPSTVAKNDLVINAYLGRAREPAATGDGP